MENLPAPSLDAIRFMAQRALLLADDFDDDSLLERLRVSAEPADRQLAAAAAYKTSLARTLDQLGTYVAMQHYTDQPSVDLLVRMSEFTENQLPLIEALKQIGLRAARAVQFEEAMYHLEQAMCKAASMMDTGTRRGRLAWNYLKDRETDEALAGLASRITLSNRPAPAGNPLRCAILCSGFMDENSGTMYVRHVAKGLIRNGIATSVVSTGHTLAPGERALAEIQQLNIPVFDARKPTYLERLRDLMTYFVQNPVDVAIYVTGCMDVVAKVATCICVAPSQLYLVSSFEPFCGHFDRILHINENQCAISHNPGSAIYIGNGSASSEIIDSAVPIGRAALGIPEGGVLFGTVGRLRKLLAGYLTATVELLRSERTSLLAIAGPGDAERAMMENIYRSAGVLDRVFFLGRRQHDVGGILKTFDVYLDPFPESGGQALFEAMRSGRPVVAMNDQPMPKEFLTPMEPSAATERLVGVVDVADSIDDYVRLALRYARDPGLRRSDGEKLVAHSRSKYDFDRHVDRIAQIVRESAAAAAQRVTAGS
jgi:glycosyltransferase involved in cell wall biosynthesis